MVFPFSNVICMRGYVLRNASLFLSLLNQVMQDQISISGFSNSFIHFFFFLNAKIAEHDCASV